MLRKNKLYLDETYKRECGRKIDYAKAYLLDEDDGVLVKNEQNTEIYDDNGDLRLLKPITGDGKIKRKL